MRDARATAERLGERMREATPPTSLQQNLEGRARLIASVERMRDGRARPFALVAAGLAVAACAIVMFVVARGRGPAAIAWHVVGAGTGEQGYVSVPPAGPGARLAFDDGSEVALAPGSRGRVAATSATGAEVVLEQGRARVHVQHRARTSWTIDAGPYAVHVTGTQFLIAWAADAEVLDVWMHSGRVVVTGPMPGETLTLGEGQHLSAHLRDHTVQIDASPEPAGSTAENAAEPPPSSASASAPEPEPTPADIPSADDAPAAHASARSFGAPLPSSPSWSKLVSAGEYDRVVRDAEAEGMPRAVATRPLADLRALGDAARYAGRADLAKRAYSAVRARFPASGDARTAAFLIGRVEEEQDHAPGQALRWYDAYLTEAPGGAYAGDALGRKMIIVSKTQGRDAARPLAARYLQRYSGGPYAAAARDLAP